MFVKENPDRKKKPTIDNCPSFRPILSTIGTPPYNLAKFLVPILSPLTVNEFTVHDSFSFADEVANFDANCIMASSDVPSLFTSIPLDETIENCIDDLFSNNDTVHNFIKEDLKELLKFASYESFFTFYNEYYCQSDGVAIGSPLGPTLANSFLCHFEKQGFLIAHKIFALIFIGGILMIFLPPLILMSN